MVSFLGFDNLALIWPRYALQILRVSGILQPVLAA